MYKLSPEYEALAKQNAMTLIYGKTTEQLQTLQKSTRLYLQTEICPKLHELKNKRRYFKELIEYYCNNMRHTYVNKLEECFKQLAENKEKISKIRKIHDEQLIYLKALEMAEDWRTTGQFSIRKTLSNRTKTSNFCETKKLKLSHDDAVKLLSKLVKFVKDKDAKEIFFDIAND